MAGFPQLSLAVFAPLAWLRRASGVDCDAGFLARPFDGAVNSGTAHGELKRERASDAVVGQIHRYMGYVQEELLEPGQSVEGVIIAREDDLRIRRALSITTRLHCGA
ncbi:hypothetical protein [Arthrobacter sp. A5]|uniref:hypothetical protein n=1 Tax=Arthrobacter sp. A5 TaxID=576926 RepID=UPI003DA81ECC